MYEDFITAIWKNENLRTVYDRLIDEVNRFHEEERTKINRDYQMAQNVLYSLHEPTDSAAYKWALAFIGDAKSAEKRKSQDRKAFEARRREIEAELEKQKEAELEERRRQRKDNAINPYRSP